MTAIPSAMASVRRDLKVMSLIGIAHFFSHFYILTLPPLFPVLRAEYGVGYAALGLALAILNGITGLTQAPVGFLVDRFGARTILIAGLALFSLAIGLVGVFPSYPMLLALMVLAGLGNSVFHPADYAILSSAVDQRRMGRAFSIHTFGGHAGFALAPPVIVFLTAASDWRIALALAAAPGLVVSLLLALNGDLRRTAAGPARAGAAPAARGVAGIRLLLSGPILMALLFFAMLAMSNGGYTSFSVAAIAALYQVPLAEANLPLTLYLASSAVGVLAGGWVADRTPQHHLVVAGSFILVALVSALIPELLPPLAVTAGLFALAGFFSGLVAPSRDMMVRAVTPPGASGKVFGFVTTGFNVGGIAGPLLFGAVLDFGDPGLVFWTVAALSLLTLLVVYATARSGQQPHAAPVRR
jgi:FSR family fosmidomycin resistance protein-like MFS transporter